METIRLSIIGMGRMGITHFSIINSHPRVEVVSVSDTSKVVLDILKKNVSGLEVFTDYKEMIEKTHAHLLISIMKCVDLSARKGLAYSARNHLPSIPMMLSS